MAVGYLALAQGFSHPTHQDPGLCPRLPPITQKEHSLQEQSFTLPVLVYLQKSTAPAGGPIVLYCPRPGTVQLTLRLSR